MLELIIIYKRRRFQSIHIGIYTKILVGEYIQSYLNKMK